MTNSSFSLKLVNLRWSWLTCHDTYESHAWWQLREVMSSTGSFDFTMTLYDTWPTEQLNVLHYPISIWSAYLRYFNFYPMWGEQLRQKTSFFPQEIKTCRRSLMTSALKQKQKKLNWKQHRHLRVKRVSCTRTYTSSVFQITTWLLMKMRPLKYDLFIY